MKLKYFLMATVAAVSALSLASCSDDDKDTAAKAVLASADVLKFDGLDADPFIITVYSDATWEVDAPEWIAVEPAKGSGTTEVTISVNDNLRDGALDNPRKGEVVFHGTTLASRATVLVRQAGDNYRDCPVYGIDDINAAVDETYFNIAEALVVAKIPTGVMISDDSYTGYVLAQTDRNLAVGDKVELFAQKMSDTRKLPYITPEKITVISSGNAVALPEPTDITATVDSYKPATREYVSVFGILSSNQLGNTITVSGAKYSVTVLDLPEDIDLSPLSGHFVTLQGFFAGVAAPFVQVAYTSIEDGGEALQVLWEEDFEWLQPWAEASSAGRTVETDNPDASAPQIIKALVEIDGKNVSALDEILNHGYELLRVTTKTEGECIYLQNNYLKFGKTSYQAGIVFPTMETLLGELPADKTLYFGFDWCPMRQGSGKIDPVNLILIVDNDGAETIFDIPTHGWAENHKLEWIKAEVALEGVEITPTTKLTLRQTQWPAATANRWFLDNVKIFIKL